ncbi:alcohol dehydrogenase catalytic domain-containing protein [Thermodesulfobacteriota bacterium]
MSANAVQEESPMKAIAANFSLGREVWQRFSSKLGRKGRQSPGLSLQLIEMPQPTIVSPQWVKIRSIMSGISDLDEGMILNQDPATFGAFVSFPFVPGNENLGIVTEVGDEARGIEVGERVVVNPLLSCEARQVEELCPSCTLGEPSACRNFANGILSPGLMIGSCKDTAGGWGDCFIAHKSQIRPIPQHMDSDTAILIPEFSRVIRAVLKHRPTPGDRVLVVGGGSMGLLTLKALELFGGEAKITLVVEYPFEADVARKLGYKDVIVGTAPAEAYEEIAQIVGGSVRYPEFGHIFLEGGGRSGV